MSDYLLREIRRTLERPTRQELLQRIADLPETRLRPSAAKAVRAEREAR